MRVVDLSSNHIRTITRLECCVVSSSLIGDYWWWELHNLFYELKPTEPWGTIPEPLAIFKKFRGLLLLISVVNNIIHKSLIWCIIHDDKVVDDFDIEVEDRRNFYDESLSNAFKQDSGWLLILPTPSLVVLSIMRTVFNLKRTHTQSRTNCFFPVFCPEWIATRIFIFFIHLVLSFVI